MMNKKRLIVKMSSLEESLAQFKHTWERAEKGEKFDKPIEILSFENASALMRVLSPKRLILLQVLHALGVASIRQLAKELDRDYSNVYQDIHALHQIGVVLDVLDKTRKFYVPWEAIVTEISLCSQKQKRHRHLHLP